MTVTSTRIIKQLLVLFLVFAGLHYAKTFLMPLCIAGLLATLYLPLCKWLEKKKVPRIIAALACVILFLSSVAGVAWLLGWQISGLTNDFARVKQQVITNGEHLQQFLFSHLGLSSEKQSQILNDEQPSLTNMIQAVGGSLANFFTNFILVLAYIFMFLYYREHIRQFIVRLTPAPQRSEMDHVVVGVTNVSQQYLVGLSKMIFCLWIMYGIGFSLIGVKNPLFFAVLCGLLEIVPFVGNITGTTITVLVTAVQGASLPTLVGIVAIYAGVQLIQGWILEPIILGPQVKINPFSTVLALVMGELIWGIPGIFLAIPVIAMFKIVCDHVDSLKPYGFLIGTIEKAKRASPK